MSCTTTYRCDICHKSKQQSNKWFKVRMGEAFHIYYWDFSGEGSEDTSIEYKHVCGQQCLLALLQPFLDRNK